MSAAFQQTRQQLLNTIQKQSETIDRQSATISDLESKLAAMMQCNRRGVDAVREAWHHLLDIPLDRYRTKPSSDAAVERDATSQEAQS